MDVTGRQYNYWHLNMILMEVNMERYEDESLSFEERAKDLA